MITFREFITKIYKYGHFAVYEPNRDCLIYESYYKHHSHYKLKEDKKGNYQWDFPNGTTPFFDNNPWIDPFWHLEKDMDSFTKKFLEKYGDYEVHSVEECLITKNSIKKDKKGDIKIIQHDEEEKVPYLGIFICSPDPERKFYDCDRCAYSKIKEVSEDVCHRGFISIPDEKCQECRNCWRYKFQDTLRANEDRANLANAEYYELSRVVARNKYDAKLLMDSKDVHEYNKKNKKEKLDEKDYKILKEAVKGWFHN